MKFTLLIIMVTALLLTANAKASLIDRGNGLIYDTDLDITWLADANYAMTTGYDDDGQMNWQQSLDWVSQLTYGGFSDWRLPTTMQPDLSCSNQTIGVDSTLSSNSYNCTGSEMGHLFYNELGAVANASIFNSDDPAMEFFSNFQLQRYWTSTEYAIDPTNAWLFGLANGSQGIYLKNYDFFAMAVHDGDIGAVPVPGAVWLFGSGLLSLVSFARKKSNA